MPVYYSPHTKENARELRKNQTPQERKLWYLFLRDYPTHFRKQRRIGHYIADFVCEAASLMVEIDGGQHYEESGLQRDAIRTEALAKDGYQVLRFTNADVDRRFADVCETIAHAVQERVKQQERYSKGE